MEWRQIRVYEDELEWPGDPADLVDALVALLELVRKPAWMRDAACRGQGVDQFFPGRGQSTAEALAMCARCPVKGECRDWAVEHQERGIWGGTASRA